MNSPNDSAKKIKIIELAQKLKKNVISLDECSNELNILLNSDDKTGNCCDEKSITHTSCKYPNGMPLTTLEIDYCEMCFEVHNVTW